MLRRCTLARCAGASFLSNTGECGFAEDMRNSARYKRSQYEFNRLPDDRNRKAVWNRTVQPLRRSDGSIHDDRALYRKVAIRQESNESRRELDMPTGPRFPLRMPSSQTTE